MTGALYLVALTNFVAALPAAPGSIGTFDAAVAFGAGRLGASGSAAVSYLIMLRFVLYVPITVVGFVVLVTRYGGWSKLRAALRTGVGSDESEPSQPAPAQPQRPSQPAAQPQPSGAEAPTVLARRMRVSAAQLRLLRRGRSRPPPEAGRFTAPPAASPDARPAATAQMAWIIAGCLLVAALSLLFPSTPTYDPWAWILWGNEIAHLDRHGGRSLVEAAADPLHHPVSLLGHDLAPYLWLWVARAGGLLACVMAYRLASRLVGGRLYGVLAGVSAFAALFASNKYVRDAALGNSEPILAAVVLWAFERHLDGRRDHARTSAWPPRSCAPRHGPSSPCTGSGCGSPSRA